MITVTRTASIAPGKTGEALAFGQQIAKHIRERHGITLEVLLPVGGNPLRIAWKAQYESLAQVESFLNKLLTDKVYVELVAIQRDTFLPGSVQEDIWRTI